MKPKENKDSDLGIKAQLGRLVAGSFYDHQEVRIREFNRVRDIVRRKIEGISTEKPEEKKDDEDKHKNKFVDKKILIYVQELLDKKMLTEEEAVYLQKVIEVQKKASQYEKDYEELMKEFVEAEPIYQQFLTHIRGISTILSANLIKEFGYCENAPHISSLWKYCGMHVVEGKAPKRKKGVKLDFNLRLRTLCFKISDSFVKQRTPYYRDIYDVEKEKQVKLMSHMALENHKTKASQCHKENHSTLAKDQSMEMSKPYLNSVPENLKHADLRARRKAVKHFLAQYWMACKEINSPILRENHDQTASQNYKGNQATIANQPYVQAKMGHTHIVDWKTVVKLNLIRIEKDKLKIKEKKEESL